MFLNSQSIANIDLGVTHDFLQIDKFKNPPVIQINCSLFKMCNLGPTVIQGELRKETFYYLLQQYENKKEGGSPGYWINLKFTYFK